MSAKRGKAGDESPLIGVLKATILDCGLTVAELSKRTGVSHPQISRFVRGERTLTLPNAEKLVNYFGLRLTAEGRPGK